MHNPTSSPPGGFAPEFIAIHSREAEPRGRGRGRGSSSRGHYGPPKTHRGVVCAPEAQVRSKRKREATSGDEKEDSISQQQHLQPVNMVRMPWHPNSIRAYSEGIIGLHEELEDLYEWMVPTVQEHKARLGVVDRIRRAVLDIYPSCRVEIFGSFRTGLYLPTSDIDLVICGKWPQLPFGDLSDALQPLAKKETVKSLERAAVPIIKLADDLTGIRVDISFNMANGLRAAELIKHFKKRFPALPKLIYVLKQFLYQRDLNEVYSGGLSSYALILMVVSFLQLHIREDARTSKANLGVLLVEFFELYGILFNFTRTAIRIADGGAYIPKEECNCYQGGGYGTICIEDPFDPSNDVGRSSYGFPTVKKTFEQAYFHLLKFVTPLSPIKTNQSILSQILSVDQDVLEFRNSIANLDNNEADLTSEDPLPPPHPFKTASKDVSPKELPDRYFRVPSPQPLSDNGNLSNSEAVVVFDKATKVNGNLHQHRLQDNGFKASKTKEIRDNFSGVSVGTTSSLTSDDTEDSDVVVLNGNATPHSVMSISPATSEVGSSFSNKSNATNKLSGANGYKTKSRTTSSAKNAHDRADLDFDWRSSSSNNHKVLSADEGPNWRDRDPKSDIENVHVSPPWRLIKSGKSRKLQQESEADHKSPELVEREDTTSSHSVHDNCMTAAKKVSQQHNDGISNTNNSKKKKSRKNNNNKRAPQERSDTNSSKDTTTTTTTAESDTNLNEMIPRVSRLSGHNKPKR